jgi:hypothetical protein
MTQQRRNDFRRGRPGDAPPGPRHRDATPRDPGAYIGRMPERATETIPGGVGPRDERVSAVATQPGPVRGDAPAADQGRRPEGHREGTTANDDRVREAGQNR